MPIAHIHLIKGRTAEQKAQAIAEVTDVLSRTLDAPKETVRVLLHEVSADDWGIGGVSARVKREAQKS